jgi:uncharacterized membrane protein
MDEEKLRKEGELVSINLSGTERWVIMSKEDIEELQQEAWKKGKCMICGKKTYVMSGGYLSRDLCLDCNGRKI